MSFLPRTRLSWRSIAVLVVLAAVYAAPRACDRRPGGDTATSDGLQPSTAAIAAADADIERLIEARADGEMVEGWATVERLLDDDLRGSRHQRFIVRLNSGRTLLISHNIDLAPRLDALEISDRIQFRGEYVWNSRGGLIHWTHHDPDGRRPGGWIRHASGTYQ